MKKFISAATAMLLALSCAFSAFAATKADVKEKISAAVKYGFGDYYEENAFSADDAASYLTYLKSGNKGAQGHGEAFAASVSSAVEEGKTDVCNLALFIQCFELLGKDTADLEALLKQASVSEADNVFAYFYAVQAAKEFGLNDLAKSICETLINEYYTLGEGTDFWGGWGTSADDLSAFLLALAPYKDDYKEYVADAPLLEKFKFEKGYSGGYDEGNTDSTAYALAAYSALGNKEAADDAYKLLLGFYDNETGGFSGEWDPFLSTRNAVFGLEYYLPLADEKPAEEPTTKPNESTDEDKSGEESTASSESSEAEVKVENKNDSLKSPATGAGSAGIMLAMCALGAAALIGKKSK